MSVFILFNNEWDCIYSMIGKRRPAHTGLFCLEWPGIHALPDPVNIFFWLRPRSVTLLWHATVSPGVRFLIWTLAPFAISRHVIFCIVCCNRKIAICIHSNAKENFICIKILEEPLSLVSFYVIDSINTINFARCSCVFKAIAAAAQDWLCILNTWRCVMVFFVMLLVIVVFQYCHLQIY